MFLRDIKHIVCKSLLPTFCQLLIVCLILFGSPVFSAEQPKLPRIVRKAVRKAYPKSTVRSVETHERDEEIFYEIGVNFDGEESWLLVRDDGHVIRRKGDDDEDEEEGYDERRRELPRQAFVSQELRAFKPQCMRQSIEFLVKNYPENYTNRGQLLENLADIEKQLARLSNVSEDNIDAAEALLAEVDVLRREVMLTRNPLLPEKLVFIKRYTYQSSHHYTDFIDGVGKYGGNICTLSLEDGTVTELVPSMEEGFFDRCDLSFDGERVVFAWKRAYGEGFRIYEVNIDGTGLRQLTFPPPEEHELIANYNLFIPGNGPDPKGNPEARNYNHHTDDMHPCYLPDGGVCFISTRCQYGTLCDIPDIFSTTVLYRIEADGSNLRKLSNGALSEAAPSVTNDGRILYTRWEYVDKGTFPAKGLWAVHPDGTGCVEIFGNQVLRPMTLIYGQAVPNTADKFFAIATYHGPYSVGKLVSIDISLPIRTMGPVKYVLPEQEPVRPDKQFHADPWLMPDGNYRHFIDPLPLSEQFVMVAYNPNGRWNNMTGYGLYMVDAFGNRVLIHEDPDISCWQPIPLRSRPLPTVLPSVDRSTENTTGTLLLTDVYQGLDGVEPGTIKWLRIVEQISRPWAARRRWPGDSMGGAHTGVSANTHLGLKVMHGVVPVLEDGSAFFTVPAERNIYLQALDEDFMEVQRMRTFVNLQPNETRSCIGCHEMRQTAPQNKYVKALSNPPLEPQPQPGDKSAAMTIHYPTYVQPILDKHCIKCHSGDEPKDGLDLSGELTRVFSKSYENLLRHNSSRGKRENLKDPRIGLVTVIREEQPEDGGVELLPPYSLGSHASRLITILREGHNEVTLSREEFIRLVTWIDTNGQYYGSYYGRRNLRYKDHYNFRPTPTFAQAISTTAPLPQDKR